ncbi:hypothetical protein [Thermocrinis minervae]|uniref:hypothetical protein n=1 Tax=Thermocrinis minervae TaxID=381751 RepID=UPI0009A8A390|nr:hypothetical protein [Thermocrinis minervae]
MKLWRIKTHLAIKDKFIFRLTCVLSVVLPVAFLLGEYYHIPVFLIIGVTALVYGLATFGFFGCLSLVGDEQHALHSAD